MSLDILFLPFYKGVLRYTLNPDSLEVNEKHGYFRNNGNYLNPNVKSIMVVNPSNSTDWTDDPSCLIKFAGDALFYGTTMYISAVTLDKFDFNLNGDYCNPPLNYNDSEELLYPEGYIQGK